FVRVDWDFAIEDLDLRKPEDRRGLGPVERLVLRMASLCHAPNLSGQCEELLAGARSARLGRQDNNAPIQRVVTSRGLPCDRFRQVAVLQSGAYGSVAASAREARSRSTVQYG